MAEAQVAQRGAASEARATIVERGVATVALVGDDEVNWSVWGSGEGKNNRSLKDGRQ